MSLEFVYGFLFGSIAASAFGLFCLYCVGLALEGQDNYALRVEIKRAEAADAERYLEENR